MSRKWKKYFLIVIIMVSHTAFSYAVIIDAFKNTIDAAEEHAHRIFVQAKWIENIRILNQNFQQSKAYYDYMRSISSHKGGITGYVKDRVTQDLERANNKIYWEITNSAKLSPKDKAYEKKWMYEQEKKINAKLDYSKEVHDIGVRRDGDVKAVAAQAAKPNPTAEEVNRLNRTAMVLQLEMLSDINKQLSQLYLAQIQSDNTQFQNVRDNDIAEQRSKDYFSKMMTEAGKKTPKKDPLRVLGEVPR